MKHITVKLAGLIGLFIAVLPFTVAAETSLSVPYYSQGNCGWCWAASAAMVGKYYVAQGASAPQLKPWYVAALLDKGPSDGGNYFDSMSALTGC